MLVRPFCCIRVNVNSSDSGMFPMCPNVVVKQSGLKAKIHGSESRIWCKDLFYEQQSIIISLPKWRSSPLREMTRIVNPTTKKVRFDFCEVRHLAHVVFSPVKILHLLFAVR